MEQLNIISMFFSAGLMVKFVMTMLLVFSLLSWFIIFRKFTLFRKASADSVIFLKKFWKCQNLAEANRSAQENEQSPEAAIFRFGYAELQKLSASRIYTEKSDVPELRLAGLENLKRTLRKAESMEINQLGSYLPFLATTGSATPFIGLFGTVWGIMTSFQDIGARGSASLAVVAPGISEALVATAAGLAVAIPAVIFYNYFNNKLALIEANMQNFSDDLLNLIGRDLLSKS